MTIAYDPRRSALYTPESQDTLFQCGEIYSPLQLAVEGARLAYYRAEQARAQMKRLDCFCIVPHHHCCRRQRECRPRHDSGHLDRNAR